MDISSQQSKKVERGSATNKTDEKKDFDQDDVAGKKA